MNIAVMDAPQRALAFLTNQAMRIEREVYAVRYPNVQYPMLVPVDMTGPPWVAGVTYFSSDMAGRAGWFTGKADDVPHADVVREKFEAGVSLASIGYEYDLEELGRAMTVVPPVDLRADKAIAARRAAEEFIDKVAMTGDTTKNYSGVINNALVTAGSAAATGSQNGATNSTLWVNKLPAQILADVNNALSGMFTTTYGAEMADTLLLPYTVFLDISTRPVSDLNQMTILAWLKQNNVFTAQGGRELTIRGGWGLDTAGSGGTKRMVAYNRDPSVLTLYMPMPFQFLPAWQSGPIKFEVPGIFRISGVEVRRPSAMRYVDGL
jgi:hypothetical protein